MTAPVRRPLLPPPDIPAATRAWRSAMEFAALVDDDDVDLDVLADIAETTAVLRWSLQRQGRG